MQGTILVIDDDVHIRDLVARYCTRSGYRPAVMAESRFFDAGLDVGHISDLVAVVTDIFMPGKSGIEVIREIRDLSGSVKIIAMSGGWSSQESRDDALKAAGIIGVDASLPKPFTLDDFRSCLIEAGLSVK